MAGRTCALTSLAASLTLLGCLSAAAAVFDPYESATPALRVFRDADGLPQNTVHAIGTDAQGFLWVGTQDGAAFYNGRAWTQVNMPERTRSNFVRTLLAGADGSIWFGTQAAGLARLLDGRWTSHRVDGRTLGGERVNALLETRKPDGGTLVWAAIHGGGLARFDGERWSLLGVADGLPAARTWAVFVAGDGTLWVGTEAGAACLRPGAARFAIERGLPRDSVNSFAETVEDGAPALWIGTYGGGLARLVNGTWSRLTTADGLPSNHITSLAACPAEDGSWTLWIGTDGGGLARLREGRIRVIDASDGLPSNAVYSLFETRAPLGAQALWAGTRNGGLARIKEGQWRSLVPPIGGTALPVLAIAHGRAADGSPTLTLGTDGGGLARLDRNGWTRLDVGSGALPDNTVQCLLEGKDESGRPALWAGTRHGGLARLGGGRPALFNRASGALPGDTVECLLETEDAAGRTLWVGTRDGLARFAKGRWTTFDVSSGLPHARVLSLLEERRLSGGSRVWAGTWAGLARFEDGAWQGVYAAGLLNESIQALLLTRGPGGRRLLWAGTDGGGVTIFDLASPTRAWRTLTDASSPSLPNNVVYAMQQDGLGRVWIATNKGVARVTLREEAAGPSIDVLSYTVDNGLPSNQGTRGAANLDSRGRVWLGTAGGAAVFDPARERLDASPKRLVLGGTLPAAGGGALSTGAHLPTRSRIRFDMALLSYFREADTRYRTQLVGLEETPSEWSSDPWREFSTLPGGSYTFLAWGRDWAGNETGPVELSFSVAHPRWLSWWAALLVAAALGATIAGLLHARGHRHRLREEELLLLVDARTRELREANQLLVELSYLDPLTGIGNRRRFDERFEAEWRRTMRAGAPLSMAMIDIDHFKAYNDAHGHQAGDECLRAVATALADGLPRAGDAVARYGGEEFAVILPLTDRGGGTKVAEQLRAKIEALAIPHLASPTERVVTISCGVATVRPTVDLDRSELLRLADEALYRAKQAGRNRTVAEHGAPRSSGVRPPPVRPAT